MGSLVDQVRIVFGSGTPNANSVLGKLDNLQKQLDKGHVSQAQSQALDIVSFIQQKAGKGGLAGTPAQIQLLISSVLCYAGITPDSFLVNPTDAPQILLNTGGAAVSLQGNTVTVPTLITITLLPPDVSPLNTKLDVYPGFVLVTQSSPLTKPAVVAVCPSSSVPPSVLSRLRLGHQAQTGFEITPAADGSFLDCSTFTGSTNQSRVSRFLNALASLVTPKPLYAKVFGGGIAGLASEFSPFGPVDPELQMKGGIGGLASEFRVPGRDTSGARRPNEMPRINTVVGGVCTAVDATAGTAVDPLCRPLVTLTTQKGTLMQNVPVGWAIGLGGGVAAPEVVSTLACGAFGSTAATTTDANGKAGVCWTLGAAGTNTVIATPTAGGDAPAGVTFSSTNVTFTAAALQITPTVTATGGTFVFDGLGHAGSGTCSNGLTPALTYDGNGSVPNGVGIYTLTVTCGAGNPLYVTVTQTAPITITPAATTASVSCPASVVFTGSPITPCAGQVTGAGGLSLTPTPTYSSNVVGTATASVNYAGGGNYSSSSASATFQISYAQSGCFASPISSTLPPTTSPYVSNGIKLSIKCALRTAQGTTVTSATGNLLVQDRGTNGLGTPVTVFSLPNAFRLGGAGTYGYEVDTSPAGFVSNHYSFVSATWNDGSTTTGWFYLVK